MQTNVDILVQAATDAGVFESISHELWDEQAPAQYPFFVVDERRATPAVGDTKQCTYLSNWRYRCHIGVKHASGWDELDALLDAFLAELPESDFVAEEIAENRVQIGEVDALVATFTLQTYSYADYISS